MIDQSGMTWEGASRHDVEQTLDAILKSPSFSGSAKMADFLTFIVEKTLDGQQNEIKAYTIAVDAMGRDEDFDPQSNAAVRVAAGRLRQALALYDASFQSKLDPARISLEAGSYVPAFSKNERQLQSDGLENARVVAKQQLLENLSVENDEAPLQPKTSGSNLHFSGILSNRLAQFAALLFVIVGLVFWFNPFSIFTRSSSDLPTFAKIKPSLDPRAKIAVSLRLPNENTPAWMSPKEISATIAVIIARFDDFQFLGITDAKDTSVPATKEIDYQLNISAYGLGNQVSYFAQLVRVVDHTIIWSIQRKYDAPSSPDIRDMSNVIGKEFSPLASPYGVIYADISKGITERADLSCIAKTYQYFFEEDDKQHFEARECAEQLIETGAATPSLYAALAFLYLDEHRENRNRRDRDPLAAAARTAQRAIAIGPQSPRAHQAMFAVHKVLQHTDDARLFGKKAVSLNPFDSDILGDYGAWLISVGEFEEGRNLLDKAGGLSNAAPAWMLFYRFLSAELAADFKEADAVVDLIDPRRSTLLAVASAIGSHRRGDNESAEVALGILSKSDVQFVRSPSKYFQKRGFSPQVTELVVNSLNNAGLQKFTPTN